MAIHKIDIPSPYEKSKKPASEADNQLDQTDQLQDSSGKSESKTFSKLNWEYLQELSELHELPANPDFKKTRDGQIEVAYLEMNERPYRVTISGKKQDCSRRLDMYTKLNVVYIPPASRAPEIELEEALVRGTTLYLCENEIDAFLLSEKGFPAVGLPRPNAFLTRPRQMSPHKLIKQIMNIHKLDKVAYLAPAKFDSLPRGEGERNPYEFINASAQAEEAVSICASLEKSFPEYPVFILRHNQLAPLSETLQQDNWIRQYDRIPVSSGTNQLWKESFSIDSAEKFYAYHGGPTTLGYVFQFGKNVYEYDSRTGILDLAGNSLSCFQVSQKNGQYWTELRGGGELPISDFSLQFELEVKQEDSFFLTTFKPIRGREQTTTVSISELTNPDRFKQRVVDIAGSKFNFWGSKTNLEQIVAMSRSGVPEAISLEKHLGYHSKSGMYVYGNGVLLDTGVFVDADERGVAQVGEDLYFLPGYAHFNEHIKAEYRDEREFQYLTSSIELQQWVKLFVVVHGRQGHMALSFLFSSLYLDLFREEGFEVFPHFSLFAPPESGKSSIVNSLSRFFGNLTQSNLRAGVTHASFDRKIEKFHDALIILNEFNLSNPKVQRMGLEEYLVGVYDNQAREKTVNNRSKQSRPHSAIFTLGQESFWHKEALATRCIIQELEGKVERTAKETQLFNELEEMVKEGISEFNSIFFAARPLIKEHLREEVKQTANALKSLQKGRASARLVLNWSMAITPLLILLDHKVISYPLTRTEIIGYASDQIAEQSRRMISEGVLNIFFSFIASEYGPRKLLSHQDVWIYAKEEKLRIRLNTAHRHFRTYILRENYGIENTSANDLLSRLKNHPAFLQIRTGVQIGFKTREGGYIATNPNGKPIPNTPGCKIIEMDLNKIADFSLPSVIWHEQEEEEKGEPTQAPY